VNKYRNQREQLKENLFLPLFNTNFTNKSDLHDIAEILLKVALNTTTLTPIFIIVT
jgi:hypothetical protein